MRLAALAHPIRLAVLEAAEHSATSPSELAVRLDEPLGVVAYHVRVLHTAGLIELVATEQRGGFTRNVYRTCRPGWSRLAEDLRGLVGATD